jgi:exo-1,4-beta-D-glucosaminidase
VGSNFYWLSTKPETLDWAKSNWYTTPTASFADYTALAQLPKVQVALSSRTEIKGENAVTHATLVNRSKNIAFFLRLQVKREASENEILPVIWEDNYISLLPGEKREVTATYRASALGANAAGRPDAVVEVKGWNAE